MQIAELIASASNAIDRLPASLPGRDLLEVELGMWEQDHETLAGMRPGPQRDAFAAELQANLEGLVADLAEHVPAGPRLAA